MDTRATIDPPGSDDGRPEEIGGSSYLYLNSSRRGFLTGLATVALGATAIVGWLVGFTPSAVAQGGSPQYPCCPDGGCLDSPASLPAGTCMQSCFGPCVQQGTGNYSCCYYWPSKGYLGCDRCLSGCTPAYQKVKVYCNPSDHSGYICLYAC